VRRYAGFERYLTTELVPWVAERSAGRVGIAGASYGAHVAANLLFKQPGAIRLACGLGGVYGLWHRLEGHHDDDVYFHTPLEYLPRLTDQRLLDAIRATRGIDLYGAEADPWIWATLDMARILAERALPHHVEIWPAPAAHHERWWAPQLRSFLERHY
jgi:esterase/lipase superfamily enzyme